MRLVPSRIATRHVTGFARDLRAMPRPVAERIRRIVTTVSDHEGRADLMKLKIFAALIIVWGSFAAPASAQPSSHPLLTAAEWTFFAAAQADAGTTYRCQASHSCIEVDPLYAHLSPSASVGCSKEGP